MWPYYTLFAPIAIMAIISQAKKIYPFFWVTMFFIIVLFVGLRHHVGMDWNNYLLMIERANYGGLLSAFDVAEPGYALLLWVSGQMGWGIYGTYLMGTFIFAAGLFRYARITPYPWLALCVAMPFLIVVVSMSAARQTVAIGILLWVVSSWAKYSILKRILFVLLAASFHMSAVIFLLFIGLELRIKWWLKFILLFTFTVITLYILMVSGHGDYYDGVYVSGQTEEIQSSGAFFHTFLNAGPAILAFAMLRKYQYILLPDAIHRQLAIGSIVLLFLVPFISAASGRLTLYLFPVSMMVLSGLPILIKESGSRLLLKGSISFFMIGLLVVWLTTGNASFAHQKYQNALFINPYELKLCCK